MKDFRYKNEYEELHRLIGLYYEGMTTLAEEQRLRSMLANPVYNSPEVEEARAVMGLFACARRHAGEVKPANTSRGNRVRRTSVWVAMSAAASVAVIICAVLSLTNISVGNISEHQALAQVSKMGMRYNHDSIAQLMDDGKDLAMRAYRSVSAQLTSTAGIDTSDDVDALISRQMGYMAEAERTIYESVADDFSLVSGVMR